jgi:hypothetical protein
VIECCRVDARQNSMVVHPKTEIENRNFATMNVSRQQYLVCPASTGSLLRIPPTGPEKVLKGLQDINNQKNWFRKGAKGDQKRIIIRIPITCP